MPIPLDDDDQEWLIDGLGALVQRFGANELLHRELLLPTDEFFPDVWSPDVAGASRMVRRLMAYCGLHDVVFIVVQLPRDEDDRPIISHRTDGASLVFEVNPSQLDHPEIVASAAWREVVEVWCERQLGDAREDVDVEFASVFLGGGVLLANGALTQRVRREGLATVQETFSRGSPGLRSAAWTSVASVGSRSNRAMSAASAAARCSWVDWSTARRSSSRASRTK